MNPPSHWREDTLVRKRLVKSNNKWLFGVAGGLADYFGFPPTLIRVAFIIATFFSILGLVIYFILAVWMPKPPPTD